MSEQQSRGIGERSKYDAMTTEELEEILRLDAEAPEEQESDTEMILYIMEVLAERKRNNGHTGNTAREAYESFKRNYMPETDLIVGSCKKTSAKKHGKPRWLRSLTATAAVLAILIVGSVTANAFGLNIWKAVVQWSRETFHFGASGASNANDELPYASFQEALIKWNAPVELVPTWIPEGFVLKAINVENNPMQKVYVAKYIKDEQSLVITVQDYLFGDPVYVEQSDGLIEEYEVSGTIYYLFSNYEYTRAVWLYESYECDISGDVTIEEMKEMIDSIQKG